MEGVDPADAMQAFMQSMQDADELKTQLREADAADAAAPAPGSSSPGAGDWAASYSAWEQWNVGAEHGTAARAMAHLYPTHRQWSLKKMTCGNELHMRTQRHGEP